VINKISKVDADFTYSDGPKITARIQISTY